MLDSDEVARVLAGEITCQIGDEVSVADRARARSSRATSRTPGRTPAAKPVEWCFSIPGIRAGGYVEELLPRPGPMKDDERTQRRERYRWEIVGPNPL
jgi:hypothetical protein